MKDVFELELPDLLYFIKASCHEGLHEILDELNHTSEMDFLSRKDILFIQRFTRKLEIHLKHEENFLFPQDNEGFDHPLPSIQELEDDHEQMKEGLIEIRIMTGNYHREENFVFLLKELDRILLNHIQLENNLLFPLLKSALQ
jgi:iron-sulfur cluster repair protein YtfE (RIC family)